MIRQSNAEAWTVAADVAPKIVAGLTAIRPAEALIVRRVAAVLAWLCDGHRYRQTGFATLAAFAKEFLHVSHATARGRTRLDRLFKLSPSVERAFLRGELTACKVLALAPVIESKPEKAARWIPRARNLSVVQLRAAVKKTRPDADLEEPMSAIQFHAPPPFFLALDETADLARRRIGYNAPLHEVIEAILAENGYGDVEVAPKPKRESVPQPIILQGKPSVPTEAVQRAGEALAELVVYLRKIAATCAPSPPSSFDDALAQLDSLHALEKPLHLLQARLLRDLRDTRAVYVLGYRSIAEFAEKHLGVSERTARNMARDAELFEDMPAMKEEYLENRISLGKAQLVRLLTHGFDHEAFYQRAREVTHRQLSRETCFLLHLRRCFPELAMRFRGPLPEPGLEEALIARLLKEKQKRDGEESWTRKTIEAELVSRKIDPIEEGCSLDPAENPVVMYRLEALLDLLATAYYDDPPTFDSRLPRTDRQTFSNAHKPEMVRISAPPHTVAAFWAAIDQEMEKLGPFSQTWQAAAELCSNAHDEWSLLDPEWKPKHVNVFTRDRFLCMAPGCPKRGDLHGHHMEYRSHGGSNHPWNLLTLCFMDHKYEVHAGHAKLSGRAPQALLWHLGCRPATEPYLILRGERIVGGTRYWGGRPPPSDVRRTYGT